MSKVYVFGSGPAGLVAAHAAADLGHEIEILTNKMTPSVISGAQYLDKHIPGVTSEQPDSQVKFYKHGKATGYAMKIYSDPKAPTSWDKYEDGKLYPLWYLRDTYSHLWELYKGKLVYMNVDANVLASFMDTTADLLVVAMPLASLCIDKGHNFQSQKITTYAGVPADMPDKYRHLMQTGNGNWILYNGKRKSPWYRCSVINDGASLEVPGHYEDGFQINKPLSSTCNCWSGVPRVALVGRYGRWEKDELVSGAWDRVRDALQ